MWWLTFPRHEPGKVVDTDAAADEIRAGKVLKKGIPAAPGIDTVPGELSNLKAHNLDKAHSARRIGVGER